ncbi:MAG: hypothetical protein MUE95_10760 [Cyclobacteriaceae bacterium]|nr:hypothetical protein [Cyclobacteriaceae bacterium]
MKPQVISLFKIVMKSFIVNVISLSLLTLFSSCFENPKTPQLTTAVRLEYLPGNPMPVIFGSSDIISDGGSEIFERGFCYGPDPNPTVASGRTMAGFGNTPIEATLPLPPGTSYVRAYAANGAGIGYGESVPVTVTFMEVVIMDFGDITASSAFMRGRIESNQPVTSRGACWSTNHNPTINDFSKESASASNIFEVTLSGLTPGTTYYTRAYAKAGSAVFYSSELSFTTIPLVQLTTREFLNAGTFVLTSGGTIISGGGVTEAGLCWNTNPNPTIANNRTVDYVDYMTNSFYSDPYGLQAGTTYYFRAYATNMAGTAYGNERVITMPTASVSDVDGNPYASVTIGTQVWLTENLKTTRFSNGDPINRITDFNTWKNTIDPAWDYPVSEEKYNYPYGKLYNWYAVSDQRNVCPAGWHVPSDAEWQTLIAFLGGSDGAGSKLKEAGIAHWKIGNYGATNSSRFTALPAGAVSAEIGSSYPLYSLGLFWTPLSVTATEAKGYYLFDAYQAITNLNYLKQTGMSVRCIKD